MSIRISRELRRLEARQHAAGGYEIEVHTQVAAALNESQVLTRLGQELSVTIVVTALPDMHPENFSILQLA